MDKTVIKREKKRAVRYQIQLRTGVTKLLAEFDGSQLGLLGQVVDLVSRAESQQRKNDENTKLADSNRNHAAKTAEI